MSEISRPWVTTGKVKWMCPSAESSTGPVKTSPDGKLRLPSELIQVSAGDAEAQVGAGGSDVDVAPVLEPVDHAGLAVGELAPGGDRVGAIEHAGGGEECGELVGRHVGVLGEGGGGEDREGPAALAAGRALGGDLPQLGAGAVPDGLARGIDGGEGASVRAGQYVDGHRCLFAGPTLGRRDALQLLVRGDREQVGLRLGEGGDQDRVRPTLEYRAVDGAQERFGGDAARDGDGVVRA